ncbi:hypothetical protein JXL19_03970 [bacterium]|nr:hypothetical protein [bacterium]
MKDENIGPYYDNYRYYYNKPSPPETVRALKPLINQFRSYDMLRTGLEEKGGHIKDLKKISEILKTEFNIRGNYRNHTVTLIDQSSIYSMLYDVGDFDLHLNIRQLDTGMPVYYLCRSCMDYWEQYGLIVQDIYKSPGYPIDDERFVKLMNAGHEVFALRLSWFREPVLKGLAKNGIKDDTERQVDRILYNTGRYVFQSAWHEDQRLGVKVSIHFGLENFLHCVELLYLCLNAELCELRSSIDDDMMLFFDQIYPQPAIHSFLKKTLKNLDGGQLNEIPQKALSLYSRLSISFSQFLDTEISWGYHRIRIPLYKIIYGNFYQLDIVGRILREDHEVKNGAARLESDSQAIIREIL